MWVRSNFFHYFWPKSVKYHPTWTWRCWNHRNTLLVTRTHCGRPQWSILDKNLYLLHSLRTEWRTSDGSEHKLSSDSNWCRMSWGWGGIIGWSNGVRRSGVYHFYMPVDADTVWAWPYGGDGCSYWRSPPKPGWGSGFRPAGSLPGAAGPLQPPQAGYCHAVCGLSVCLSISPWSPTPVSLDVAGRWRCVQPSTATLPETSLTHRQGDHFGRCRSAERSAKRAWTPTSLSCCVWTCCWREQSQSATWSVLWYGCEHRAHCGMLGPSATFMELSNIMGSLFLLWFSFSS